MKRTGADEGMQWPSAFCRFPLTLLCHTNPILLKPYLCRFFGLTWLLWLAATGHSGATHIRAGEIIAERLPGSTLTYRITLVGYRYNGSDVPFGTGDIDFGDGTVLNVRSGNQ
ncbi:MAG: hypothetical protein HC842_07180, partial [Cytophagales bacterium]|nr:hypothetical protein [Cytophagales bacterium]